MCVCDNSFLMTFVEILACFVFSMDIKKNAEQIVLCSNLLGRETLKQYSFYNSNNSAVISSFYSVEQNMAG